MADGGQPLLQPLTRTWSEGQHLREAAAQRAADPAARSRARGSFPRAVLGLYLLGLRSALGVSSLDGLLVLLGFFRLQRVRTRVWQCILLNGLLFLGSLIWFWAFVDPCIRWLLVYFGTERAVGPAFFETVYNVLWVYPMYVMTLAYVSPRFFDDIARGAFDHTQSQFAGRAAQRAAEAGAGAAATDFWSSLESSVDGTVHMVSDGAMLNSLIAVFYLQAVCLTEGSALSLPSLLLKLLGLADAPSHIGTLLVKGAAQLILFSLYTWLYSLYCFNYKWSLLKWPVKKQITTIEAHWAFFAGFGTPAALISVFLNPCWGLGCYSTFFPLLLLAAEVSTQPSGHVATQPVTATITRSATPPSMPFGKKHSDPTSAFQTFEADTGGLSPLRVFLAAEHVNGMLLSKPIRTIAKGACLFVGMFVANVVITDRWFTMAATLMLMMLAIAL